MKEQYLSCKHRDDVCVFILYCPSLTKLEGFRSSCRGPHKHVFGHLAPSKTGLTLRGITVDLFFIFLLCSPLAFFSLSVQIKNTKTHGECEIIRVENQELVIQNCFHSLYNIYIYKLEPNDFWINVKRKHNQFSNKWFLWEFFFQGIRNRPQSD